MIIILLLCCIVGIVFYRVVLAPVLRWRQHAVRQREFWYPRR